jgi:hypothetical protein
MLSGAQGLVYTCQDVACLQVYSICSVVETAKTSRKGNSGYFGMQAPCCCPSRLQPLQMRPLSWQRSWKLHLRRHSLLLHGLPHAQRPWHKA